MAHQMKDNEAKTTWQKISAFEKEFIEAEFKCLNRRDWVCYWIFTINPDLLYAAANAGVSPMSMQNLVTLAAMTGGNGNLQVSPNSE